MSDHIIYGSYPKTPGYGARESLVKKALIICVWTATTCKLRAQRAVRKVGMVGDIPFHMKFNEVRFMTAGRDALLYTESEG